MEHIQVVKKRINILNKRQKNTQGRSLKTKTPVIGIKSRRTGKIQAKQVGNVKVKSIKNILYRYVSANSIIYSDEFKNYNFLNTNRQDVINYRNKQYLRGEVHTNGIENFWSIFKRGYIGVYHWMSRKHLQKYINEFLFRYNNNSDIKEEFDKLLSCSKKLTYRMMTTNENR